MSKRTYKPKVQGYVPEALDGDGDGMVQDGTEFERPVGTEFDWAADVVEEAPEETFIHSAAPETHTVLEGENIQAIAERYKPAGMTRNEYAAQLHKVNGDFSPGKVIRL
jgi:hypothetical protein